MVIETGMSLQIQIRPVPDPGTSKSTDELTQSHSPPVSPSSSSPAKLYTYSYAPITPQEYDEPFSSSSQILARRPKSNMTKRTPSPTPRRQKENKYSYSWFKLAPKKKSRKKHHSSSMDYHTPDYYPPRSYYPPPAYYPSPIYPSPRQDAPPPPPCPPRSNETMYTRHIVPYPEVNNQGMPIFELE